MLDILTSKPNKTKNKPKQKTKKWNNNTLEIVISINISSQIIDRRTLLFMKKLHATMHKIALAVTFHKWAGWDPDKAYRSTSQHRRFPHSLSQKARKHRQGSLQSS